MSFVFRKIRKAKWYKNDNVPWLGIDELQADALGDLQTSNNTLSIFIVADDQSNLERIAVAFSATSDSISNFDYALVDMNILLEEGYIFHQTAGETPDAYVNSLHQDLIELSVSRLTNLAETINHYGEKSRIPRKQIERLLRIGIETGQLETSRITGKTMRKKLNLPPLN